MTWCWTWLYDFMYQTHPEVDAPGPIWYPTSRWQGGQSSQEIGECFFSLKRFFFSCRWHGNCEILNFLIMYMFFSVFVFLLFFFVSLTCSGFRLGEVYLHPSLGWSFCFCWSTCITRWVNEWTPRWLFHMFLGRICSSQFFVVEEMSFCWGQTILKVAGSTTVLKIWQKLSKLIGLAPITRAIFPAAAWDSVFDLAFLRLGLLEFWGVSAWQDDHVLDYLNEDGLSVEPRGFSQSGLSQHASWNQQLQLRCINP